MPRAVAHPTREEHRHVRRRSRPGHRHAGQGLQHRVVRRAVPEQRAAPGAVRPGRRARGRQRAGRLLPSRSGREPQGRRGGQGPAQVASQQLNASCATPGPRMPAVPGVAVDHRAVHLPDGTAFHVAEAGSGPPLVLLHGWPQHWWAWRKVLPALAGTHRVVCPDLRGLGWSDAPPGDYAKEAWAADVVALLDALGLERVDLAGHDWGGLVALLLALRAPGRGRTVAALSTVHPWPPPRATSPPTGLPLAYQLPLAPAAPGPPAPRTTSPRPPPPARRRRARRSRPPTSGRPRRRPRASSCCAGRPRSCPSSSAAAATATRAGAPPSSTPTPTCCATRR